MGKNKQLAVNIFAQFIAFAVNFGINFFLTPFIIENVGREAYGFVSLGNNFVNYAALSTIALNSMAGRFITLHIHKDDFKTARQYYSTVILSDIFLSAVLSIPCIFIVLNLSRIVNISYSILTDITLLWCFLFFNFIIGVMTSAFGVGLFASNRIDIKSKRNIISYFLRGSLLLMMFSLFEPKVWYIGFVSTICTIYTAIANQYTGRKLLPDLKFHKSDFSFSKVKELLASGVWNLVSRVGSIILTELDLLLSNLFVSAEAMGTLSIAKTIPNYISSLVSNIISAFLPQLIIDYAEQTKEELVHSIKSYMKILLYFQSIIYGLVFAYFNVFLKLWIPEQKDLDYIYLLAMISISGCFISSVSYIMNNIFTATNKLRFSSIVVIFTGLISFALTYLMLKITDLGLIAIASVSVALVIFRNIFILLPYGAKCIDCPWYTFFPDLFKNILIVALAIGVGFISKLIFLQSYNWIKLIIVAGITALVLAVINYFIVLNKEERLQFAKILKKIRKRA